MSNERSGAVSGVQKSGGAWAQPEREVVGAGTERSAGNFSAPLRSHAFQWADHRDTWHVGMTKRSW